MNKETGGPAFPLKGPSMQSDACGMTLRDYFATRAMQGFVDEVGCNSDQKWFDEIAEGAYKVADAMLKAREK